MWCDFDHLPEGLWVEKNLGICQCEKFTSLPKGLVVGRNRDGSGGLTIEQCDGWDQIIPPDALIQGVIRSRSSLFSFKSKFPEGGVTLEEWRWMQSIEDGVNPLFLAWKNGDANAAKSAMELAVQEEVMTNGNITGMGLTLAVRTLLHLDPAFGSSAFGKLESRAIEDDVDLRACCGLTDFPKHLIVFGNLDLSHCPDLVALGEGLRVEGNLDLSNCKKLQALPEDLHVSKNLSLRDCSELHSLPERLSVGSDSDPTLDLSGCSNWDGRLPKRERLPMIYFDPSGKTKLVDQEKAANLVTHQPPAIPRSTVGRRNHSPRNSKPFMDYPVLNADWGAARDTRPIAGLYRFLNGLYLIFLACAAACLTGGIVWVGFWLFSQMIQTGKHFWAIAYLAIAVVMLAVAISTWTGNAEKDGPFQAPTPED